ncbi:DUF7693 family protein [Pseudomonas violetae]|uniref:DUF7693 family protein n=1 Tax=Pseudomonas violetae TaxID=2915813 RepID=UPI003D12C183
MNITSLSTPERSNRCLGDVALGARVMKGGGTQSLNEIYHDLMPLAIYGWVLTLLNDCDTLGDCEDCRPPERSCQLS